MDVLIVYAKAGAGHLSAAEAVYHAFKRQNPAENVAIIDCLDYTPAWFKRFYPTVYIFLVRYLSLLWQAIYYSLENRFIYSLIRPLRRLNNRMVTKRLAEFIKKEKPQVIISTQFFASEVVASLKRGRETNAALISIVTDFGAHTFWESDQVDIFVVASEYTKQDLIRRGMPEAKIRILGIPIEPPLKGANKLELRRQIGLRQELFTVLTVGGGFGVGPIKELVFSLDSLKPEIKKRIQLIVVCSKNKNLYAEIEKILPRLNMGLKLFGFVEDLYKMMSASDIIISKSGGLTTSESLASGLPMIIISPIPGQESKNCALLVEKGAAIEIKRAFEAKGIIESLLNHPERLQDMRRQARMLSRPDSALEAAKLAKAYLRS